MVVAHLGKNLRPLVQKWGTDRQFFCLYENYELYAICSLSAVINVGALRAFVTESWMIKNMKMKMIWNENDMKRWDGTDFTTLMWQLKLKLA